MAQCAGQSWRTGERCRRAALTGTTTCSYHAPGKEPLRVARSAARPAPPRLSTKLLSPRTCDDFEALFAPGTGWGRCACLFALDAKRVTRGGSWADQRETNLATMRALVGQGRSHGVLVYDAGTPVGWCQFVPGAGLRFADVAASGADWYVTCFVVDPASRGTGVSAVALRAAVDAIRRKGGGVVEGSATAIAEGPPPRSDRRDLHVDDGVLFWGGVGRTRDGVDVDGVGPVTALYRTRRSMHGAPLGGTVDLFRGAGFEAVRVLPRPTSALVDRIAMRREV